LQQFKLERNFVAHRPRKMGVDLQVQVTRTAQGDLGFSQRHVSNRIDATVLNGDEPG
jgi:hypothetical protein